MKKNFIRGLPSLSSTLSSSSSSSSGLLSLVLKYLLVIFLLIEQGGTDLEEINNDPIALLQKNLKYWRSIYDTYKDEIKLGYCWADYLFGTNDIRSDFISNIIEKEFMQLENNFIQENCENDTKYCDNYFSYGNYSEYDVNFNSSDEQKYNEKNITTEKNLNDILRLDIPEIYNLTQQASTDQVDDSKNQSLNDPSSLKGKRLRRHNEQETIIEPYIKLGNPYQRYFFFIASKVFTSLKKKLALVSERSLSLKESNILRFLVFLTFHKLFNHDKIITHEYFYLYDILRNQMLRIDGNDTNDWKEESKTNQTIWSIFDDNKEDKVQVQDLTSFRKNLKTRNKRFARSILPRITENSIFIAVYRTLTGIFRAGQLITEVVDSNNVLKCTKDYLLKRIIEYIDSL